MGVQLFANGAAATLSGTLAQGGTTMTLAAGTGVKFPSITGGDYFYVTLFTKDAYAVEQNIEVVKVTARTGDTLILVRDIESMTGQTGGYAYDGNATTVYVQLRLTAATADGFLQKSGNLAGLADTSVARANLGAAPTASPSFTGNVSLTSSGARILGDFSNVTIANRAAFQSSTVNGDTRLVAIPNGTATVSGLFAFNSSDPGNAHWAALACTSTSAVIASTYVGSPGSALPLSFDIAGETRAKLLPTGEMGVGVTPTAGQGTLQVPDINGAATSGFRNKIINGCCRISRKGIGAAALGFNGFGADGINTYIGGWSAVTGTIAVENAADFSRTSSGGTHYTNITAATGGVGYITYLVRIEAADALELAGRPFTASARITSLTKQIDDVLINILKANTVNNFGASTLVANVAGLGPVSANTTKDVAFSTTLTTADCVNGLQIEFMCYYGSAVTAAFHCFIADLQCCAGSQRMPFELRPIAIEEQLRRRYYRKQAVWVGTSTARTVMPIDMFGTPTITGGGTGYVSTGTDKDTLVCYQTTAGLQTLVLNSELV